MTSNNISITTKHKGHHITTQIDLVNKTIYVVKDERFIFNGDLSSFKARVAKEQNGLMAKLYSQILNLAEELIDILSSK